MINKDLPEPTIKECVYCYRKNGNLKGTLIHWPNKDCTKKEIKVLSSNIKIEPFSMWIYTCQWCRGIETKKRNRLLRRQNGNTIQRNI
jgi:hypothetical protein